MARRDGKQARRRDEHQIAASLRGGGWRGHHRESAVDSCRLIVRALRPWHR